MGGKGSGRKPKEENIVKNLSNSNKETSGEVSNELILPNYSGVKNHMEVIENWPTLEDARSNGNTVEGNIDLNENDLDYPKKIRIPPYDGNIIGTKIIVASGNDENSALLDFSLDHQGDIRFIEDGTAGTILKIRRGGTEWYKTLYGKGASLGNSSNQFIDLYLSGVISDGTNSVKVANIFDNSEAQTIQGTITPSTDNSIDLGSGDKRFRDIYVAGGSLKDGQGNSASISDIADAINQKLNNAYCLNGDVLTLNNEILW